MGKEKEKENKRTPSEDPEGFIKSISDMESVVRLLNGISNFSFDKLQRLLNSIKEDGPYTCTETMKNQAQALGRAVAARFHELIVESFNTEQGLDVSAVKVTSPGSRATTRIGVLAQLQHLDVGQSTFASDVRTGIGIYIDAERRKIVGLIGPAQNSELIAHLSVLSAGLTVEQLPDLFSLIINKKEHHTVSVDILAQLFKACRDQIQAILTQLQTVTDPEKTNDLLIRVRILMDAMRTVLVMISRMDFSGKNSLEDLGGLLSLDETEGIDAQPVTEGERSGECHQVVKGLEEIELERASTTRIVINRTRDILRDHRTDSWALLIGHALANNNQDVARNLVVAYLGQTARREAGWITLRLWEAVLSEYPTTDPAMLAELFDQLPLPTIIEFDSTTNYELNRRIKDRATLLVQFEKWPLHDQLRMQCAQEIRNIWQTYSEQMSFESCCALLHASRLFGVNLYHQVIARIEELLPDLLASGTETNYVISHAFTKLSLALADGGVVLEITDCSPLNALREALNDPKNGKLDISKS